MRDLFFICLMIFLSGCHGYQVLESDLNLRSTVDASSLSESNSVSRSTAMRAPVLKYLGTDPRLYHASGFASGTSWATNIQQPNKSYITYGPYTMSLEAGRYVARFALSIDNNYADNVIVASVDVNDAAHGQILAREDLSRRAFSGDSLVTDFDVPFNVPIGAKLEFRVYFHTSAPITHHHTLIFAEPSSYIAMWLGDDPQLSHQVGSQSGSRWVADTSRPTGRAMTYGPYTTSIPSGEYVARFTFNVDNNTADNNSIVTIDVNDSTQQRVLASRTLTRMGFAAPGTPMDFDLRFFSTPGDSLEFRVWYNGNSYVEHLKTTILKAPNVLDSVTASQTKAVFSLDQGFGNGIVTNNDLVSVQAISEAIAPLASKYDVYVLLSPMLSNKQNLYSVLDAVVANNQKFILDVYSSDASSLGLCTAGYPAGFTNPDGATSLSLPLSDLYALKIRYGQYFGGLRIFEMIGQDNAFYFSGGKVNSDTPCWMRYFEYSSSHAVFKPQYVEQILNFAQANGMFVQIADWNWSFAVNGPSRSRMYEQDIARAISAIGGRSANVYMTFDNNNPIGGTYANAFWKTSTNSADWDLANSSDWYRWIPGLQSVSGLGGAAKIGLSDQHWMCAQQDTCPSGNLVTWAWGASRGGAKLLQFEAPWFFFDLPVGSFNYSDYTSDGSFPASRRGQPKESFRALNSFLLSN